MFDFEDAADASTDNVIGRKFIYGIVSNPIWTALIIVTIIMIMVMYNRREPWKKKAKIAFWIFVATLGVIWLHDKVLIDELLAEKTHQEVSGAFDDIDTVNLFDTTDANKI